MVVTWAKEMRGDGVAYALELQGPEPEFGGRNRCSEPVFGTGVWNRCSEPEGLGTELRNRRGWELDQ